MNGPDLFLASEASFCAHDQGEYWKFHDELYKNWRGERTREITRDSLDKFANTVNLDLGKFNRCLDEKKYQDKILSLYEFGKKVGIDSTPSFLVFNYEKIIKKRGNQPSEIFLKTFDEL